MSGSSAKHDIHRFRNITKLTDENWVQFKFELKATLEERGLYDVIEGEGAIPDAKVDPEAHAYWKDMDNSARAQIVQNLSSEVQPIVFDCITAKSTWQALKDEYESHNLDKLANTRLQYDTKAYVEGTSMRDHLNRLDILRAQLKAMGDEISDTSHAMRMIRLLPPTWEGVCQVLRASEPTVTKVKDRLLAEEESRKTALSFALAGNASALSSVTNNSYAMNNLHALLTQFGVSSSDIQKVIAATSNGQSSQSKLKNPHLKCSNPNCMKKGHVIDQCWAKGGGREGKGPKSKTEEGEKTEANLTKFYRYADEALPF